MEMRILAFLVLVFAAPAVAADVDHSKFDALLKANVKGDRVNYAAFKDNADFQAYVALIGQTDPASLPDDKARLAFWINAYNALTINGVLQHWPKIESVSAVYPEFGFFKRPDHTVGGKKVSLDEIENKIVRPTYKDPRVHAAFNCASISCPPLQPYAFTADKIDDQLNQAMTAFIKDRQRNQIDPQAGTLKLSQIFNWYKDDFEPAGGARKYIADRLEGAEKDAALKAEKVEFLNYDWALNKQ
jgi:hypothetical protein